jgi:glucose-6-phosphate 1-dehydrogenase
MHSQQQTHASEESIDQESLVERQELNTHLESNPVFHQPHNGQTRPPTLFVIFGAQGDLTKRKLIPALYNLAASGHLPQEFAILGVDGISMNAEDFRNKISRDIQELSTYPIDLTIKEWLLDRLYYLSGDFRDPLTYESLQRTLTQLNSQHGTRGNYLYYMATSPTFFGEIVQQLGEKGLVTQDEGYSRRVVI